MRTRTGAGLAVLAAVGAWSVTRAQALDQPSLALANLAAGWSLGVAGVILFVGNRTRGRGLAFAAASALWFAANLGGTSLVGFAHRGPLLQGAVVGERRRRLGRTLVAAGYAGAWIADATLASGTATAIIALALLALAVAARERAALPATTGYAAAAFLALAPGDGVGPAVIALVYDTGVLVSAAVAVRAELARPAPLDVVVELAEVHGIEQALARALEDPGLRLVAEQRPADGTVVVHGGAVLGTILHRPHLLDDDALRREVTAAAALTTANARLVGELEAQVAEGTRAARRLVEVGDEQRRALERLLDEGAVRLLDRVDAELAGLGADVAPLRDRLSAARTDIADLARGLHPRSLEQGLAAAVGEIARSAPLPVAVEVGPVACSTAVTTTAFYVCAEAITNAARHARARAVRISIRAQDGLLRVEVSDDGRGGADPARGSGLAGLADRCGALGGTLRVDGVTTGGTRVVAELPCV